MRAIIYAYGSFYFPLCGTDDKFCKGVRLVAQRRRRGAFKRRNGRGQNGVRKGRRPRPRHRGRNFKPHLCLHERLRRKTVSLRLLPPFIWRAGGGAWPYRLFLRRITTTVTAFHLARRRRGLALPTISTATASAWWNGRRTLPTSCPKTARPSPLKSWTTACGK